MTSATASIRFRRIWSTTSASTTTPRLANSSSTARANSPNLGVLRVSATTTEPRRESRRASPKPEWSGHPRSRRGAAEAQHPARTLCRGGRDVDIVAIARNPHHTGANQRPAQQGVPGADYTDRTHQEGGTTADRRARAPAGVSGHRPEPVGFRIYTGMSGYGTDEWASAGVGASACSRVLGAPLG